MPVTLHPLRNDGPAAAIRKVEALQGPHRASRLKRSGTVRKHPQHDQHLQVMTYLCSQTYRRGPRTELVKVEEKEEEEICQREDNYSTLSDG